LRWREASPCCPGQATGWPERVRRRGRPVPPPRTRAQEDRRLPWAGKAARLPPRARRRRRARPDRTRLGFGRLWASSAGEDAAALREMLLCSRSLVRFELRGPFSLSRKAFLSLRPRRLPWERVRRGVFSTLLTAIGLALPLAGCSYIF